MDFYGQFVSLNRRVIEEPNEMLTFNLRQLFINYFNRMYES